MSTSAEPRVCETHSVEETFALASEFAKSLQKGDVVALEGELGAGKTCFVKGIAQALGVTQVVTSPTFTLIHEYRGGKILLFHVDLYRLDTVSAAQHIGIEDYLPAPDGVAVVEWAEKIRALLPEKTRRVRIEIVDETTRRFHLD
jgi:tRNA threonylcarbamoyladenosine biosynthesis protein TsaE